MNTSSCEPTTDPTRVDSDRDRIDTWIEEARRVDPDATHELVVDVLAGKCPAPRSAEEAVRRVRARVQTRERTCRRRRARLQQFQVAAETIHATIGSPHGWVELRELVAELLKTLGPVDTAIFCLRAQGWQAPEIAVLLGLSTVAVRQRVCRLRRRLEPMRSVWIGVRA